MSTVAFANVEPAKRPAKGERLEVLIAAAEVYVAELEAIEAEQKTLAEAHAAWAKDHGTEAMAGVTDPQALLEGVGLMLGFGAVHGSVSHVVPAVGFAPSVGVAVGVGALRPRVSRRT